MSRIERFIAWAALGAVASCAPPRPVIVYLPPSVSVDSAAGMRRNVTMVPTGRTFWEAMAGLDTGFVKRYPVTEVQRAFAGALGAVMTGRPSDATVMLDSIMRGTDDSVMRLASRVLLTAMLQYQDRWSALAELPARRRNPGEDKAGVESWAAAFKSVPERRVEFPATPVVLPLSISAAGTPMVQVRINGKLCSLWLDTGSSLSILASDVAEENGIEPLVDDTLEIATTTGRVPALPTAIREIDIGGIRIVNSTAMIVSESLMRVQFGVDGNPQTVARIDGVIGFDILRRLDVRIDYVNQTVTFLRPVAAGPSRFGRNLYWVGMPVVRLLTRKGTPLHFNLDTGAEETYATDGLSVRAKTRTFAGERRLIGGFAGLRTAQGRFVDELHLITAGQPLVFRKLLVFAPDISSFVSLDGVLGSDVGRSGVVRIDATNGLFSLEAAVRPRLRPRG